MKATRPLRAVAATAPPTTTTTLTRLARILGLLACALGAGCGPGRPDAPIRDLRPTQIERGDKVIVEAAGPIFTVGAPTTVVLNELRLAPGGPVRIPARATSRTRVLFDADQRLEQLADGHLIAAPTTVTVEQVVAGETLAWSSSPLAPFKLDLFPRSLRRLADRAAQRLGQGIPPWPVWALFMALAALLVALPVPLIGGLIVVWERKVSAYMQSRLGPNRVGPGGWLQWLADGLKLLMKEDVIPAEADPILFRASPYLAFVSLFLTFMVIPFSGWLIVADLDIGLLFLLSVTSLVVVSLIMGGWSSNSKWSLLGGMRSAAQIISYELPASVALLGIATLTGSLSTVAIVRAQSGAPWGWYVFHSPFTFTAFFIHFIAALAEGNRTPFDLPEAESELVAGYFTEYSGFRFSLFPLVEWVNLFVIGAVSSMLFLGGWNIPFVAPAVQEESGWLQLAGLAIFLVKIVALVFVTIWIRWTLPRFRVDQMMNLCWKYLIPLAFACFVGTLAWSWLVPAAAQRYLGYLWFALFGLVPLGLFIRRVRYNRARYLDLDFQTALAPSPPPEDRRPHGTPHE